jgi:Nicotinate phosphoribosyltransferase C-terminal domain
MLIRQVMRRGERLASPSLEDARRLAGQQLGQLPAHLKRLATEPAYPVEMSERLRALAREVDHAESTGA